MLIKPDIKEDMFISKFFSKISRVCIGLKKLECMANVWLCVGVRKGGSDVEFFTEKDLLFFENVL